MNDQWKNFASRSPQFGQYYARIQQQPSWVTRFAILAGLFVIVVPILILVVAAVTIFALVFFVAAFFAKLINTISNLFNSSTYQKNTPAQANQANGGRKNVRVIRRDE